MLQKDAFSQLALQPDRAFDYVYVAPPQYKEMWKKAVAMLDQKPDWLVDDAWVIVQVHPVEYKALTLQHLKEFEQRRYGSTLFIFFERQISRSQEQS